MDGDWGYSNETRAAFARAVDRLEMRIDRAKDLPDWGIALVTIICFMCTCVMFQGLIILSVTPCWMGWRRWRRIEEEHAALQREREQTQAAEETTVEEGEEERVELPEVAGRSTVSHDMEV